MGERFERCGIAIAGCLEGSGTRYLEGQLIISERTLIAILIQKAHGDEGKVSFFEGNYTEYEAWKKANLGEDAMPHRLKFKKVTK